MNLYDDIYMYIYIYVVLLSKDITLYVYSTALVSDNLISSSDIFLLKSLFIPTTKNLIP